MMPAHRDLHSFVLVSGLGFLGGGSLLGLGGLSRLGWRGVVGGGRAHGEQAGQKQAAELGEL